MRIVDSAVSVNELLRWQTLVRERCQGEESQALNPEDYEETGLFGIAQEDAPGSLIHVLLFDVRVGRYTERHQDIGEWAACFYPFDCPTGPLWTDQGEVAVKENRFVSFDATVMTHQQVVPTDGSSRHSVVFKFRRK